MSDVLKEVNNNVFWLDKWEGGAKGGFFVRNDLKDFFIKLKNRGIKPVGIKVDDSYNLEVIVDEATIPEDMK